MLPVVYNKTKKLKVKIKNEMYVRCFAKLKDVLRDREGHGHIHVCIYAQKRQEKALISHL